MSVLAELRQATWPIHQRLERRVDVKHRFRSRPAYRAHLEQLWGFCATLEGAAAPLLRDEVLPDYDARRRKQPLLERDLVTLGVSAREVTSLPRWAPRAGLDAAAALGAVYVFEGATLGGRVLLPLVERDLGVSADSGAAFLASYRDEVDLMWRRFCGVVEAWCDTAARRERIVAGATETFEQLEQWLCGAPR